MTTTLTRTRRFVTTTLITGALAAGALAGLTPAGAVDHLPDLPITDCPEGQTCLPTPEQPDDKVGPGDGCNLTFGCEDGFDITDRPDPTHPDDPTDPGGEDAVPGAVNPDVVVGAPAFTG